jgi:hypothetical protein
MDIYESLCLNIKVSRRVFSKLNVINPHLIVVETHPDAIVDLRFDQPFSELLSHVSSLDLTQMDRMTLGHIPFGVILLKAVQDWKQEVIIFIFTSLCRSKTVYFYNSLASYLPLGMKRKRSNNALVHSEIFIKA